MMPYYPEKWPGGDRLCFWKEDFEKNGYEVQILNAWEVEDIQQFFQWSKSKDYAKLYKLYRRILKKRRSQILQALSADIIWIQRNAIPIFPFKKPYYEKLLSVFHKNVIYDYYDADYTSNYNLVVKTVQQADKITTASLFLKDYFTPHNKKVMFLRYCIEQEQYITRKERTDSSIRVGWMGSPENFLQLFEIKEELVRIEQEFPNVVFCMLCRDAQDIGLKRAEHTSFNDANFNYFEWIGSLDIGLVPFFGESDRFKAKVSKKGLEFMLCGIATLSSPWVHSDTLVHMQNGMIVQPDAWYSALKEIIENKELRESFGEKGRTAYLLGHNKNVLISELIAFMEN